MTLPGIYTWPEEDQFKADPLPYLEGMYEEIAGEFTAVLAPGYFDAGNPLVIGDGQHIDTSGYISPTLTSDLMLSVTDGSPSTPSSVNGPLVMVDKSSVLTSAGCQGFVDPNCGSVIRAAAYGALGTQQQTVGLFGVARNDSDASAGGGGGDTIGVYGHGELATVPAAGKSKSALGGFFTTRRDVSPSSNFITMGAVELQVSDNTGADCLYDPATAGSTPGPGATGSTCIGAFLVHNDLGLGGKGGVGAVTRSAGTVGWQVGFACSDRGGASITCFDDVSAAPNSFRARGVNYVDVIDLTGATASGVGIKLHATNAGKISWPTMSLDPTFPSFDPATDSTGEIGNNTHRWNVIRGANVIADIFRDGSGVPGFTGTLNLRKSAALGGGDCTATVSTGLVTATTCV